MRFALAISFFMGIYMSAMGARCESVAYLLAKRVVPEITDNITFEKIEAPADSFSVSSRDGKVLIQGSSSIAMCVGLNNYLRRYLGIAVSWFADQPIDIPGELVLPDNSYPLTGNAAVDERFFLNYCTFGYTTPFWKWKDWERFIDWMALNGINMPLAMTGQEKVWYETWKSLGLERDIILDSFTGPAHLPWHWMANIDRFQGPLSMEWIECNEALQKKILERERELGMRPVLPAFSGHVPAALKSVYPEANISLRQRWCGFKDEYSTFFLDPSDPLYARIQKTFVSLQDSIYGSDHIYGIDPFNEVDSPDWSEDFLRGVSSNIFATLTDADPKAKWLQMTWAFYNDSEHWTKPRMKAFLDGVPNDGLILLDYYCEAQPVWKITDSYFGKPYILCYLGNFGGNTMLVGDLRDVNTKINDFLVNGGGNRMGMGGTLEGLDVNPVMHEFMLAKVWNPDLTPEQWIDLWAYSRGGKTDQVVKKAWKILNEKVYVARSQNGQGGLTNVRPSLTRTSAGCADANYSYRNEDLLTALDSLLLAKGCDDNTAYRFDVMNVARQLLSNEFMAKRDILAAAYANNNLDSVKIVAAQMESMLSDLDRLMATNPDYSLKKWVELARSNGKDDFEKDLYEKNARILLTTWGDPGSSLSDYANRHWSGLIGSFYKGRWCKFFQAVISCMENGTPFDEDKFRSDIIVWEAEWQSSHEGITDFSDENPVVWAKEIRQKYF